MEKRRSAKRDEQIRKAAERLAATGKPAIDPAILFGRASGDDLATYTPDMLAAAAAHAAVELAAFDGKTTRITVADLETIAPEGTAVSVLTVTDRNMPFLYDSVMGEVTASHRGITLAVHPILVAGADGGFALFSAGSTAGTQVPISHIQIHLPRLGSAAAQALVARLEAVLSQVHAAVGDWGAMMAALDSAIAELDAHGPERPRGKKGSSKATPGESADKAEALAFLRWLRDNNFTFLGMRDYLYTAGESGDGGEGRVERDAGSGLGILADPNVRVLRRGKDHVTTTPEILAFLEGPDHLIVTKANVRSVVHRRAYMDYVGIKRFDSDGRVTGELRVVGLFTSTAYTRSVSHIPLLRAKMERVIARFGFDPQSHSGKMLINTLESYPRDDLFQIDTDLLADFCEQINELGDRPRVRVLARTDRFDRFVSAIVYVPRDQYDSDVRERIGAYLADAFDGHVSAYYPAFPEGAVVRVHFIIGRAEGRTPRVAQATLERAVTAIATRWEDRFDAISPVDAPRLSVSDAYREEFSPEDAIADLADITACSPDDPVRIAFWRRPGQGADAVCLKIFHFGAPVALSRRVPLLENLGFRVISEQTFDLAVKDAGGEARLVVLHDMELAHMDGRPIDLKVSEARLEEAYLGVWNGLFDDDSFNRLVLNAGLAAREVMVLRAYARYLRQLGITYSQGYIADTLNRYPEIAADLYQLFRNRFDPKAGRKARETRITALSEAIEARLADVPSLDDDRILRRFVNLVAASLRTNAFQKQADGSPPPVFAVKLDPRPIEGMPDPKPYREIFVYGAEVEGVHLRFGPVARGGLRWSDRAQDYRTEVLGLVKAQQVKNAVIVPVGAKGGFYPKALPAGGTREAIFEAGREAYKTYVSTLLSVTDNIEGDHVVPPADTVRHDGDDPYFVVAADKGTATFSDTANAISQAHGFWLDDAFASGGSVGYDHKKMGITARGAWETVKRHFREMDIDIQATPFTVAGVGDMSGDVFGNGMLLSPKIRLVAAFDHRDIFIDPDPDCAASLAERQRLFDLPRSSWQDYDRARLSKGGMIVSRSEKSVTLTPEAAAAIDLNKTRATPQEIMNAILKAPVDLLWFGGIGTYVKGEAETDAEVGDRANDAIRITGAEVRARVIGEGANLGVTQRGRIAYGLKGGRCNSDAIDNSAGVNCSDVEVNIKIALASAMRDGRLTRAKRNTLLAAMTDEVAELVLRNNYLQGLAISLVARQGVRNGDELAAFMTALEAAGRLDRKVELLPDDQAMAERYAAGRPLTRAEIGVLLSYAKIVLFDVIAASRLPDDPYFHETLFHYFPKRMRKAHAADIEGHRLRREIIATRLANDVINRGGPGFVTQATALTSVMPAEVVRGFVMVRDGFAMDALFAAIDGLDTVIPGNLQNEAYAEVTRTIRALTLGLLKAGTHGEDLSASIAAIRTAIAALRPAFPQLLPPAMLAGLRRREEDLSGAGVPTALARGIAELPALEVVPEIMQIAGGAGIALTAAAGAYFAVTERFGIARIEQAAARIVTNDRFETLALARALDEIGAARRAITAAALAAHAKAADPVAAWVAGDAERVSRIGGQIADLAGSGEASLARIAVAAGLMGDIVRARRS